MAASELAWYPTSKTQENRRECSLHVSEKRKRVWAAVICAGTVSVFRNLIHFLVFSLPKDRTIFLQSCYKTELLEYNKTEEANCSTEQVHS